MASRNMRKNTLFNYFSTPNLSDSDNPGPTKKPHHDEFDDSFQSFDQFDHDDVSATATPTLQGSSSACSGPPSDIALTSGSSPVQPTRISFPVTVLTNKKRSFNPEWYRQYNWLEYSIEKNAAFCFACRFFGSNAVCRIRPEATFTSTGFRNWKHASGTTGSLAKHDNSASHKGSMLDWQQSLLNSSQGTSLPERLHSSRAELIKKNRHYMRSIIDVLLLCCQQEISLRGHKESIESANRGNFCELLTVLAKHDPIIQDRLSNGPRNATYTSPMIQNTVLSIMAENVQRQICDSVKKAGFYSILADETKDAGRHEQLSIVVRYVDVKLGKVYERFLTYVEAKSQNAESLSSYILDTLSKYGLDTKHIVSQGYDGASVMSGRCSGVQQIIKNVAPQAMYIHCYAHCLNLVLVDTTKINTDASSFFVLLEALYVFLTTSKAHAIYLEKQKELHPTQQIHEMVRLSDTRWTSRWSAVNAICKTFESIIATLEAIQLGSDKMKAIEAGGLLLQVNNFKFLVHLVVFDRLLTTTHSLSNQLQCIELDIGKAGNLVRSTQSTLQQLRSDSEWTNVYKYCKDVAKLYNIDELEHERPRRTRTLPQRFDDSFIDTAGINYSSDDIDDTTSGNQLKITFYFPVLDSILTELSRRFSDEALQIMRAVQCCSPTSESFLEAAELLPLIQQYNLEIDGNVLNIECTHARNTLKLVSKNDNKTFSSIGEALEELSKLITAFPNVVKILQIALTIVVTSASCERSFSALKRIKTYLRSTMTEDRLNHVAILSIERDLSTNLDYDQLIDTFIAKDGNRRIILS